MQATYVASSAALAATVAPPSGALGDVLYAWSVGLDNPPDSTWVLTSDILGLGLSIREWRKLRTENEGPSYTFTGVTGTPSLIVADFYGALFVPATVADANNVGDPAVAPEGTAPAQGGLLACWFGAGAPDTMTGAPAGMVQRVDLGGGGIELWTQEVPAGATGTRSNTLSNPNFWLARTLVLGSAFASPSPPNGGQKLRSGRFPHLRM